MTLRGFLLVLIWRNVKKEEHSKMLLLVIRLGLEPKTPTLKVLCSTC